MSLADRSRFRSVALLAGVFLFGLLPVDPVAAAAVNNAPAGTDKTIGIVANGSHTFTTADFGFSDPLDTPANNLLAVTITTVPGTGALTKGGTPVVALDSIPATDIDLNLLVFTPVVDASGTPYTTFTFQVQDDGGVLAGGVDLDPSPNTITVNVTVNNAPKALPDVLPVPESAGATTLAVLANDTDADGDTLTITSATKGAHGTVAITGGGTGLSYDPLQLYFGTDVFTYTIGDGHGGSSTTTVLVKIVRDTIRPVVTAPSERFYAQTVGSTTTKVHLSWAGSDPGGTGVASYKLQVSVNGGSYATVALASSTSTSVNRILTNGRTVRYRVRATDREGNVGAYVYGPTFSPGRYQNTSSSVVYSGAWTTRSNSGALGGSHRYASSLSARASITKTVRDVAWVATKTATSGSAQVWIDGVLAATINLRSSSTSYRRLVYYRHFPTLGSHTMEIRPIGGGRIYLDAILVYR